MISKQQKYINENDLYGDDYDNIFKDADENEIEKSEDSEDEPEKPNDHKSHS